MVAIASSNIIDSTRTINTTYASIERYLDVAGYIPVINIIGSALRSCLATVQIAHGIALAIIALAKHLSKAASNAPYSDTERAYHKATLQNAGFLIKNSFLNFFRASWEAAGPIGIVACLIFDAFKSSASNNRLGSIYGRNVSNLEIHRPVIANLLK